MMKLVSTATGREGGATGGRTGCGASLGLLQLHLDVNLVLDGDLSSADLGVGLDFGLHEAAFLVGKVRGARGRDALLDLVLEGESWIQAQDTRISAQS